MNTNANKFKLVYLPILFISIIFVVVYSFLNWLFVIQTGLVFSINETITKFILPIVLSFIVVLILVRPKVKLFVFKRGKDSFGLQMLACIAFAAPTIVAQTYLSSAMGKLSQLDNISQINKTPESKYYTLKNFYVDKERIGIWNTTSVSGKHSEDFNMNINIALPIFSSQADTSNTECIFWVTKRYSDRISNRESESTKDESFKVLATRSQKEFEETSFNDFVYLERLNRKDDNEDYIKAVNESKLVKDSKPILFKEVYEPFEKRSGDTFIWIFISLGIANFVWLLIVSFSKLDEEKMTAFNNGTVEKSTTTKEVFEFIVPRKGFFITPILMDLNILIFVIMVCCGLGFISFQGEDLLKWGANFRPYTTNGEWWRLLTNTFLHGGIMHLLGNMYGLLFVGIFLERIIGSIKFIIIYLLTGIIASSVSLWWHEATVSVGASGAIFGLYGCFIALMLLKVLPAHLSKAFLISALIFVGLNLIMGLTGGIDNAAHIGGLVSGFVIGLLISPIVRKSIKDDSKVNEDLGFTFDEHSFNQE